MSRKPVNYQAYFLLATLEGFAALYFSIANGSMERNAWLFGFSLPRLLLGAVLLGAVSILIWCSYKALFDRVWLARIATWVEAFISNRRRLLLSVSVLSLVVIASLVMFYFWYSTRLASLPYVLQVLVERILPAMAWVSLLSIQTLGMISPPLWEDFRTNLISQPERFRVALLTSSLIAAFIHWVMLAFQLSVFKIQYWFWNYRDRKAGIQELVFLVIFVLVIVVLRLVLQNSDSGRRNMLMIVALGYLVQLGFGIAQGQGFESLRLKYLASGDSSFSKNACGETGFVDSVRHYDELYGTGFWEGTKPPGLQALYILFGEV